MIEINVNPERVSGEPVPAVLVLLASFLGVVVFQLEADITIFLADNDNQRPARGTREMRVRCDPHR